MDARSIEQARDRILSSIVDWFRDKPGVLALFLRGSLAEGTADTWSDIDLAVVVDQERYADFCGQRHSAPEHWGDLLFSSGAMGPNMCVSHFAPFVKVDVFYYRPSDLQPSPWHARGVRILFDRSGLVQAIIDQSKGMDFHPDPSAINHNLNQAIASAHETIRRIERGELGYALSILDSLRNNVAVADDHLHDRPPMGLSHFETRCSNARLRSAIAAAHPQAHEPAPILACLKSLVSLLAVQIDALANKHPLCRNRQRDAASLAIVRKWSLHPHITGRL